MEYLAKLTAAKDRLVRVLERRGVDRRHLQFGGPGEVRSGRVTVPTDARSEFLANRAMGDWAEWLLGAAVNVALPGYKVVHYGDSDRMSAGEDGFRTFYEERLEDVRIFGKRPDLLVVPDSYVGPADVSAIPTAELEALVSTALVAVEVRSSRFEALHYMKVRAEERAAGKVSGREAQSFTVKVEDLKIVHRWIERFQKPQMYCQVFFDSMFAINVLAIFQIIGSDGGFTIENPARNQEKATILIPITSGIQIATYSEIPTFELEHRRTRLGRHDAYVRPVGGKVQFDADAFMRAALGCEPLPQRLL
ncbi:MAG: AccI family restriction endonuclease [Thermoguttaceae bacterium]|nr:AccI family restriction endonuclease [Thermoguttaceae bacterium]